jgi:glucose dehydrogenase
VSANDPLTGAKKWEVEFPEPPLASLMSTAGNLLFVPDPRGWLRAFDAATGKELWKHNDGQGHNGGIISYKAKDGKQYIAVETGWGGLAGDDYGSFFGKPYTTSRKIPACWSYSVCLECGTALALCAVCWRRP